MESSLKAAIFIGIFPFGELIRFVSQKGKEKKKVKTKGSFEKWN
jgi:hypothetical protein